MWWGGDVPPTQCTFTSIVLLSTFGRSLLSKTDFYSISSIDVLSDSSSGSTLSPSLLFFLGLCLETSCGDKFPPR